jgi:asparagine synthetase B (glutamine-hydrolysing)
MIKAFIDNQVSLGHTRLAIIDLSLVDTNLCQAKMAVL